MNPNNLFDSLEEIPGDIEHEVGDVIEDEILESQVIHNSSQQDNNNIFDIESMSIIFEDRNPILFDVENDSSNWSSKDKLAQLTV